MSSVSKVGLGLHGNVIALAVLLLGRLGKPRNKYTCQATSGFCFVFLFLHVQPGKMQQHTNTGFAYSLVGCMRACVRSLLCNGMVLPGFLLSFLMGWSAPLNWSSQAAVWSHVLHTELYHTSFFFKHDAIALIQCLVLYITASCHFSCSRDDFLTQSLFLHCSLAWEM